MFQFPSNGKVFPNTSMSVRRITPVLSFNSLQTGRSFRTPVTPNPNDGNDPVTVSIPFKREGLSELGYNFWLDAWYIIVSIPFKREGLSELAWELWRESRDSIVSIPFKREGLSELRDQWARFDWTSLCFNSLQTGRSFRTTRSVIKVRLNLFMFQFPSNGKVFPNNFKNHDSYSNCNRFQFPSNGKVFPNKRTTKEGIVMVQFQFPSNGKVFPNLPLCEPSHSKG